MKRSLTDSGSLKQNGIPDKATLQLAVKAAKK
jgi:hypothetical protein